MLPDDGLFTRISSNETAASYANRASNNSDSSTIPYGDRPGNLVEMVSNSLRDEMERSKVAL